MKKRFGYLFAITLGSFICINSNAQDYYQPAVFKTVNVPTEKIIIFPNPVSANTYFDIEIDSSASYYPATLIIYNSAGVIKDDKILKVKEGNNKFEINLGGYDQGNYVIRVVVNGVRLFSYSTQLVVR